VHGERASSRRINLIIDAASETDIRVYERAGGTESAYGSLLDILKLHGLNPNRNERRN
jgi:hypothetical protein